MTKNKPLVNRLLSVLHSGNKAAVPSAAVALLLECATGGVGDFFIPFVKQPADGVIGCQFIVHSDDGQSGIIYAGVAQQDRAIFLILLNDVFVTLYGA